jgi:D-alanyl-D-alanine dipeptidase
MLGKGGLAWGRGLHGEPPGEPSKREGDGRAPAGAFTLGPAFGKAAAAPAGAHLPYLTATETLECVDDGKSRHYNELLDAKGGRDWTSSEQMLRKDALYDLGFVVLHNTSPAVPGAGSCIFVHVWRGPGQPTVGCTSMARSSLDEVVAWLDPAAAPVLVQLPDAEYARLREPWGLP